MLFLAAVHHVVGTPLPVAVKSMPGPDEVARKTLEVTNATLKVAYWTLGASAFAIIASAIGTYITGRDYALNSKQWARQLQREAVAPRLRLAFLDGADTLRQTLVKSQYNMAGYYPVQAVVRLHNDGQTGAKDIRLWVTIAASIKHDKEKPSGAFGNWGTPTIAARHNRKGFAFDMIGRGTDGTVTDEWAITYIEPKPGAVDVGAFQLYFPAGTSQLTWYASTGYGDADNRGVLTVVITES